MVACVPTGMKTGVSIGPMRVWSFPRRARELGSFARSSNEKSLPTDLEATMFDESLATKPSLSRKVECTRRYRGWLYPACRRRFRARCTASARSAPLEAAATVGLDATFDGATLTGAASPTLSMNETSANGSDFEAIGFTSSTLAALEADVEVLAVETEEDFDVVDEVDVDFAAVVDFVPLLFAELAALCAVFLAELTSFCRVLVAPVNSPLTPAISRST